MSKGEEFDYTDGLVPPGWTLSGGWAEVHKKGWTFPLRVEVSFNEYVGKKKEGTINRMWTEKPGTMIRKVALVQALREAFPRVLAGMYSPEEISSTPDDLPPSPIDITPTREGQVVDAGKPEDFVKGETEPERHKRHRRTKQEMEEARASAAVNEAPPAEASPYESRYGIPFDPTTCSSCTTQEGCDAIADYKRDLMYSSMMDRIK